MKMNLKIYFLFFIYFQSFERINGANILGLFNIASPSHSLWNHVVVKALAERGHNLTVIIADLPKNSKDLSKNITYFNVNDVYKGVYEIIEIKDLFDTSPFKLMQDFCTFCHANCEATLKAQGFKDFMEVYDKKFKFDLILYDYVGGPCLLGLVEYFNYPPLIGISTYPYPSFVNKFSGGHFHPAYVSYHSANINPVENYVDRLYNNILIFSEILLKKFSFYPALDKTIRSKSYFSKITKSVDELEQLVTITLVNSHPSFCPAEPLPPNVIEVGGLQLIDPEPLEEDLENFIVSAKYGVIYFSLGTNVAPADYSKENIEVFLTAIKKFSSYNFLWKFDERLIKEEIPKNVLIRSFFPQRDILAHPNTKAFITHGGGLSTQESIFYGVPMLGMPLFGDQIRNIKDVVGKRIAVEVNFNALTQNDFNSALQEILENKIYLEKIRLVSKRFRDRPQKPLDTAVWWIEYILRHPNPDHLKPNSLKMSYISSSSFDFIFIVIIVLQLLIFSFCLIIYCCCFKRKSLSSSKKIKTK